MALQHPHLPAPNNVADRRNEIRRDFERDPTVFLILEILHLLPVQTLRLPKLHLYPSLGLEDPTVHGMCHGVCNSKNFLLFLGHPFCLACFFLCCCAV